MQGDAQFVAGLKDRTFSANARQELQDRRKGHAAGAQEFDALDGSHLRQIIVAIAAFGASRLQQPFGFIVAQHPNADAGAFRQLAYFHSGPFASPLTLTALSDLRPIGSFM
ncbi:hypothetical protein D3C87_1914870 [compost metagenome]